MKYFILGLVSLTVILHYCNNVNNITSSPITYPHTTVKIIDGDTIEYNGERIRMASYNAPEIAHDKPAQCGAYQSMSRLEYYLTRIRPTSMLNIVRYGKDTYGRTLATVYIEGYTTSINELMVREGFGESFNPDYGITVPNYSDSNQGAIDIMAGNYSHCSAGRNKYN